MVKFDDNKEKIKILTNDSSGRGIEINGNVILLLQTIYRSSQKQQVILDFYYEFS